MSDMNVCRDSGKGLSGLPLTQTLPHTNIGFHVIFCILQFCRVCVCVCVCVCVWFTEQLFYGCCIQNYSVLGAVSRVGLSPLSLPTYDPGGWLFSSVDLSLLLSWLKSSVSLLADLFTRFSSCTKTLRCVLNRPLYRIEGM